MLIKNNYFLIVPIAATLILSSCGGDKTEESDDVANADTAKVAVVDNQIKETFFQVPSPGEMLTFIKMVGGVGNKNVSFLNHSYRYRNLKPSLYYHYNFLDYQGYLKN